MQKQVMWFVVVACVASGTIATAKDAEMPVVFKDDFEHGFSHWKTSDPDPAKSVWKIIEVEPKGNHAFRVTGKSKYEPPFRSPLSIAILKDIKLTDFELTMRLKNTATHAGNHRDLSIIWGYQDPSHFYYVHFGSKPDPHACQIFIVNNAERLMITDKKSTGTPWDNNWHNVKITRNVKEGTMEAYFDDMKTPVMTAKDKTFNWGQVGIGTFDDNGNFDDVVLRGELKK